MAAKAIDAAFHCRSPGRYRMFVYAQAFLCSTKFTGFRLFDCSYKRISEMVQKKLNDIPTNSPGVGSKFFKHVKFSN
jgi:hypothetical protein